MRADVVAEERARLAEAFPSLTLDTLKVPARVTGTLRLDSGIGFSVNLEIPGNYSRGVPELRCDRREIPWEIDRHVLPCGRACLCVASEYRKHWPPGSDLADFLQNLVRPYFIGQAYYQAHGRWPPDRERAHGPEGIMQAYGELLAPLGPEPATPSVIVGFIRFLARRNEPGGHEACPCGNGVRLRNCHQPLLRELRGTVAPEHATTDRDFLAWAARAQNSA